MKHISEIIPEAIKINQQNKMIADFMGFPENKKDERYYSRMKYAYDNDHMKYHSSWDWLIPVYNKILLVMVQRKDVRDALTENFLVQWSCKNFFVLFDSQLYINSCYIKVVDFITWFNSEPTLKRSVATMPNI